MLSKQSPYAIYMPALSASFAKLGHSSQLKRSFSFTEADLDFLNPASSLFHYPYALYSAGQAADTEGAALQKSTVSERDRNSTTIIGDSGGFQIQEGTIRFEGEKTTERMLRWLEGHADFSMTLDFPTGGISTGKMTPHAKRMIKEGYDLEGLSSENRLSIDFNACLQQSLANLNYFKKHRKPVATNFLNVIQGRNEHESKVWYDAVKGYDLEGWAFAGVHQSSFTMLLNRLIDMKNDGLLKRAKWIHVLGVSKLANAYLFTVLLHCIRNINPGIELSFDTAGPFRSAGNLQFCTNHRIDKYGLSIQTQSISDTGSASDHRTLNELCAAIVSPTNVKRDYMSYPVSKDHTVAQTAVGNHVKVSELCNNTDSASALDSDSYSILMNHNVQAYLNAYEELNHGFTENRLQDHVPPRLRIARKVIETVLLGSANTHLVGDPSALVRENAYILDSFAQD